MHILVWPMTMVAEEEAVLAARAYADSRSYPAWREGSVRTIRIVVEGHDCWCVTADDAPKPSDSWLDEVLYDGGQSYLVDVTTAECIGVGLLNGYNLFRSEREI